ncbi:MAG: ParB N-terminal domain-containing protein [Selenomonas sp.]|uniref:ParB N-terminal domain-containing protein n=1 Tax=Selenomonas sp. TaxID=2053611 RepID=UPI0025CEE8D8|nr:ParB N-terminal domain-containing protein [Selenomonas sp.]MCR5440220.1 ParB N-terminal domain-containing protein [Selenomonas sp.]
MRLEEKSLSELNAATYNPRVTLEPGMEEFEKLKTSIEHFGDVEPIVWNERTGNVVGGHQRLQVLKFLGRETATVSVVDLGEKEEKLLNLALNKAKGEWDNAKLEKMLCDMDTENLDFTGFGPDEIAVMLASNDGIDDEDWDEGDNDWQDDVNFYGAAWIITARFKNAEEAQAWIDREGLPGTCKANSNTTVIRFGE